MAPLLEAHPVHQPHAGHALLFEGPDDLPAKLEWLHEDRSRMVELGRSAFEWIERERSPQRLRRQRVGFYESLLRNSGPIAAREKAALAGPSLAEAVEDSPLAQLRRTHRSWERRIDYFRAMLEQQPYDYVALRNVIAHAEEHRSEATDLDRLYERLCLLAPEAVPAHRRPAALREFLPA